MAKTGSSLESGSLGTEIARKSAWLISQEGADLALAFLFSWIAIRRLGPELFGLLTLIQAVLNLTSLGTYNLEFSLIKLIPDFRRQGLWDSSRQLLLLSSTLKASLAVLAAGALFVLAPLLASLYDQPILQWGLRFGCLSVFSAALAEVGAAASLGLLRPEFRTLITTIRRLVEVTGLVTVTTLGLGLPYVVMVLGIADTIAAAGYGLLVWRMVRRDPQTGNTSPTTAILRRGLRYSSPVMGARVTEIAGRELGKLALARLASPAVLGFYAVARLAADRLLNLLSQTPLASVPVLSQYRGTQNATGVRTLTKTLQRLFTVQMILGNLLAMAVWAAAPLIVQILGGSEYAPTVPALRSFSLAVILWSAISTFHGISLVFERTIVILILNLSQMALALSAYWVLVPPLEATGAALADDWGLVGALMIGLFLVHRLFGMDWRIFGHRLMLLSLPTLVMLIPLIWIPDRLAWLLLWLAVSSFVYASFLMARGVLSTETWVQLQSRLPGHGVPSAILRQLILVGSRYHRFLADWAFNARKLKT